MRAGGEYFLEPAEAVQRRYEALRCYFVEDASADSVGARFGYSPATVHQLAAELRAGRSSFFRSSKPGPKGPRKTHTIRDRVLVLRAADRSVTEIAQALTAQGDAVSAQTVWAILKSEGLERLERRGLAGPAPRRSSRSRPSDFKIAHTVWADTASPWAVSAWAISVTERSAARNTLAALPASAWRTHNVKRAGRYRHPQIHEAIVHLKGIEAPLRQIAIRNIGHDQSPTTTSASTSRSAPTPQCSSTPASPNSTSPVSYT